MSDWKETAMEILGRLEVKIDETQTMAMGAYLDVRAMKKRQDTLLDQKFLESTEWSTVQPELPPPPEPPLPDPPQVDIGYWRVRNLLYNTMGEEAFKVDWFDGFYYMWFIPRPQTVVQPVSAELRQIRDGKLWKLRDRITGTWDIEDPGWE
jgi:hypothetical protein